MQPGKNISFSYSLSLGSIALLLNQSIPILKTSYHNIIRETCILINSIKLKHDISHVNKKKANIFMPAFLLTNYLLTCLHNLTLFS
jgi:hypothetical protein